MSKCNGRCTRRKVGCRTGCEIWEAEEALKEKRYAARQRERDGSYTSARISRIENKKTLYAKQGRHMG